MFLGGMADEGVLRLGDEEMVALVKQELLAVLNIREEPVATRVHRWPRAMPQYEVGHLSLVKEIEAACVALPGLYLAGNAYRGVGVPDCIHSGQMAAERAAAS